jgi:IMP cyclohydrolase
MAIIQKLRDGFASKVAVAAVALPTAFGAMAAPALADDYDITIRYGDNVEDMDMWVEIIEEDGVKVRAINDLDNPNCAIVESTNGQYSFSLKGVYLADLAVVATDLAYNRPISSFFALENKCED